MCLTYVVREGGLEPAIAVEKCQPHCRYDTLSCNPRSIHTHFQGLCVVFALLISIPSGRLTEHCCSHLLWLCDTVESGLVPRFVCSQEIRESLLHNFLHPFAPLFRWKGDPLLITFILYHNFVDLSRGFQKFVQKFFYKVLWG